jgi:hypothetical protein
MTVDERRARCRTVAETAAAAAMATAATAAELKGLETG